MKDHRFIEIEELVQRFNTLGDEAFVKAMRDAGVPPSELIAFSREKDKEKSAVRAARRVR